MKLMTKKTPTTAAEILAIFVTSLLLHEKNSVT
ncbi:hypothetical protein SAMN06296273_0994 [Nitrosomonas ureae]|uniref:Uncharacterized protein n=1 Tax=Nitrosomonas ureae TaxID=44577 RepID=A0A285BW78_9PROT|nr:hypothetical protein SAMN06296273_0994 [Nitrosomonas ureae]